MKALTRSRRRQRGLSTVGWVVLVGVFALLVVSFFKVFPFYYDNFKLKSALDALSQDIEIDPNELPGLTPEQVLVIPEAHPLYGSRLFTWRNAVLGAVTSTACRCRTRSWPGT